MARTVRLLWDLTYGPLERWFLNKPILANLFASALTNGFSLFVGNTVGAMSLSGTVWLLVGVTGSTIVSSLVIRGLLIDRNRLSGEIDRLRPFEPEPRRIELEKKKNALRLVVEPSLDYARRFQETKWERSIHEPRVIVKWHEDLRASTRSLLTPMGWRQFEAALDDIYLRVDPICLDGNYLKAAIYAVPALIDTASAEWFA